RPKSPSIARLAMRASSAPTGTDCTGSTNSTSRNAVVRIVRRSWTVTPETKPPRAGTACKRFEPGRVPSPPVGVEVRSRGADRDEANVDVDAVTDADHVSQ